MKYQQAISFLEKETSVVKQFARSEGNNINTWIGFKHIMYLAEESLLTHFRDAGLGIRRLFEEYGLLIDIVGNKGRILHALKLDEEVSVEVSPSKKKKNPWCFVFRHPHVCRARRQKRQNLYRVKSKSFSSATVL